MIVYIVRSKQNRENIILLTDKIDLAVTAANSEYNNCYEYEDLVCFNLLEVRRVQ